jgi:hypothetical protein
MQFPKFMPLVCAAVFCAGFISVRADDNPAQAAARAALEAKMHDLDTQPASANAETPPPAAPAPTAAAPIIPVPAEAETPATAATIHADNADQSRALEALQQKMRELAAQQPSASTEASPAITIPLPAVVTEQPARPAETQPAQTVPVQIPAVVSPPAPPVANYPGKELGLKQITAPPLPVSADVEAQLQALLLQYKADQISPEEYHKRRAAILGQP